MLPSMLKLGVLTISRNQGWTQRGCLRGGTSSQRVELSGEQAVSGGGGGREYERGGGGSLIEGGPGGGLPWKFFKIYVSENAFQAILKPSFPYSITSILSKVRHSNPRGGTLIFSYIRRLRLFFGEGG